MHERKGTTFMFLIALQIHISWVASENVLLKMLQLLHRVFCCYDFTLFYAITSTQI